jgi:hypothetical protein
LIEIHFRWASRISKTTPGKRDSYRWEDLKEADQQQRES